MPQSAASNPAAIPMPADVLVNPHMNPMAGDLGILASEGTKLILVSGAWDILHADIVEFANKAEKTGVQMTYIEGEHQFHCFPVTVGVSPEVREATNVIIHQIIANGD